MAFRSARHRCRDALLAAATASAARARHEAGQPRGAPAAAHPAAHRLRRARLVVARWQADRLHGQELRRRLRRRRRDEDDPPADAGAVGRLPARAVPADRRLLPDRRPHLHRHPDDARSRPGDVAAARRRRPADRARPQDLGRRRDLAQDATGSPGRTRTASTPTCSPKASRCSTWPTSSRTAASRSSPTRSS